MEEVQMKDIFEDPVMDIDDAKNIPAVADHVRDFYAYYRKMEASCCVPPDYMSQQFDINEKMRAILIDWLIEETLVFNKLQFNMSLPTPYVFLNRFLKAAEAGKKLELLTLFLIELSLVVYEMLKFQPSLLLASAVYIAHCALHDIKKWFKTCEWYSTFLKISFCNL